MRQYIIICVIASILGFLGGVKLAEGKYSHQEPIQPINQITSANIQTKIITQIKYIERIVTTNLTGPKEDIAVNVGKQDFTVKVNGEDYVFTKDDNEKYMFEKNQLVLEQQSNIGMNIKIEPIDNTKHYGLGLGIGIKGLSGIVSFPITKIIPMDGWIHGESGSASIGAMIRF